LGVDFVTTCTPTFTKGWDTGLADVQTADLFTETPTEATRTYRVAADDGTAPQPGEAVFLRPSGGEVVVVHGRTRVGVISKSPASLVERIIGQGRGIATGTVTKVYKRSGDFDVRVN
jgi:hypothetical protein